MTSVAPIDRLLWADIHRALRDWCHLWGVEELAPEISVELSSRMTRSLGRCYPDRKLIRIAQFVFDESSTLVQEVLCHEAAHLAAYHLHGTSIRPHGREWKALMLMAGHPPTVRFKLESPTRSPVRTRKRRTLVSIIESLRNEILRGLARSSELERALGPRLPGQVEPDIRILGGFAPFWPTRAGGVLLGAS